MQMTVVLAFGIIVVLQAFGDIFSARTNGKIPSIFIATILFLIGFWTVLPTEIETATGTVSLAAMASITGPLFTLLLTLLVTNMGTLMTIKELLAQWKTLIIGVCGIAGAMVFAYLIGGTIFGREYGVVITPTLVGGLAAMNIMSEAARAIDRLDLVTIAILAFSIQGLAGFPLMSYFLRAQCKTVLADYRAGKVKMMDASASAAAQKSAIKIIPDLPAKYQTPAVLIGKLTMVAFLSDVVSRLTGGAVHTYVMCLVLGILASEIGFLEKKLLSKSETMGLMMILLMGYVYGGLATATPESLATVLVPLISIFVIGTAGIVIFGMIAGKFLGETRAMSAAIVLNCHCGFPPNYILTVEACKSMAKNDEEYNILMQEITPKILVGGFAVVTVASVFVANIFVNLLG